MHKMTAVFKKRAKKLRARDNFEEDGGAAPVDADTVCKAVKAIGFGCRLLGVSELVVATSEEKQNRNGGNLAKTFMSQISSSGSMPATNLMMTTATEKETSVDDEDLRSLTHDLRIYTSP